MEVQDEGASREDGFSYGLSPGLAHGHLYVVSSYDLCLVCAYPSYLLIIRTMIIFKSQTQELIQP